jgi:hypothetical protein
MVLYSLYFSCWAAKLVYTNMLVHFFCILVAGHQIPNVIEGGIDLNVEPPVAAQRKCSFCLDFFIVFHCQHQQLMTFSLLQKRFVRATAISL